MANLECIIHYELKDKIYSDIKEVSDVNWEKIKQAKEIRISKGGVNHHKQQCDLVQMFLIRSYMEFIIDPAMENLP